MNRNKLNILLFILPIYIFASLNAMSIENDDISMLENRTIKGAPEFTKEKIFSGEYFREYDEYFADTLVFRNNFIQIGSNFKKLRGINKDEVVIHANVGINVADKLIAKETVDNIDESHNNPSDADLDDDSNKNIEKKSPGENEDKQEDLVNNQGNGRVLVYNDAAMEIHFFNEVASTNYAQAINIIQQKLGENVSVYSMLVPTQIEFIEEKKYRDISYSQKENIEYINERFNNKVTPINVYDNLKKHSDEYIYFRTDHHWTALGAYYAYDAFMETKGVNPIAISDYTVSKLEGFLGSTYASTLSTNVKNHPDTIEVFHPFTDHNYSIYWSDTPNKKGKVVDINYASEQNKYGVFMGGDYPLGKIETNLNNKNKILIVKDSYSNALVPFLLPHYSEIYVVDPRMFQGNILELVEQNDINEVLFLNYVLVNRYDGYSKLFMDIIS